VRKLSGRGAGRRSRDCPFTGRRYGSELVCPVRGGGYRVCYLNRGPGGVPEYTAVDKEVYRTRAEAIAAMIRRTN
jgi:hypothetical protein